MTKYICKLCGFVMPRDAHVMDISVHLAKEHLIAMLPDKGLKTHFKIDYERQTRVNLTRLRR